MSLRLVGVGISGHLPAHLVLHIVLVLVLVPLFFLKILIARRYKQSHSLKALGIAILVISFALVSIPTLSELLRSARPGGLGLRLATSLIVTIVTVCLVQCALVFNEEEAAAGFRRVIAYSGDSSTGEFVSQHVIDVESPIFFVCGPKGFMDNAREILSTLGVKRERILQESFGEPKRSTEPRPREARVVETVVFIQSQKVCQLSTECTLLDLAEKNGVQIPYGCRQGLCGKCATRVLSGPVQMDVEPV
jgi:2Fe-2S iron-sulfur cluster binding domain